MEKTPITEEMGVHKQWPEDAKKQTMETLPDFLNHILNDYIHDYGTICHAISAGGLATMYAMNHSAQGGITGFQASCIMWEFIRHWNYESNVLGLAMLDYDDLLFPQYAYRFANTISSKQWATIQEKCKTLLAENDSAVQAVRDHWQSIVDGVIPFGFKIKDED